MGGSVFALDGGGVFEQQPQQQARSDNDAGATTGQSSCAGDGPVLVEKVCA